MRGNLTRAVRRKMRGRNGYSRRSQFTGNPTAAATRLNNPIQGVSTPLGPVNLMNAGNKSPFNPNASMHHNLVRLKLTNLDPAQDADLILSPGRHNFQPPKAGAGTTMSDQALKDGTNVYVNNLGNNVNVSVNAQYGFRSNAAGAWAEILLYAKDYGFYVSALKAEFNTQTQMSNEFVFQKYDLFGQDQFDKVIPSNYYDPQQFHDKTLMIAESFALTRDVILYYSLAPSESVVLHFYLSSILDVQSAAIQHARQQSQFSI